MRVLVKSLPHVQPLPEVRSCQADQCFQGDHGLQGDQRVQLCQALPVVGCREKGQIKSRASCCMCCMVDLFCVLKSACIMGMVTEINNLQQICVIFSNMCDLFNLQMHEAFYFFIQTFHRCVSLFELIIIPLPLHIWDDSIKFKIKCYMGLNDINKHGCEQVNILRGTTMSDGCGSGGGASRPLTSGSIPGSLGKTLTPQITPGGCASSVCVKKSAAYRSAV